MLYGSAIMRRAIPILVVWCGSCLVGHAAEERAGPGTKSHLQSVAEIAAVDRDAPWAGLVTVRAPVVLREQFRIERGAGLVVESVAPGSCADRAGLRQHDIIVSLDGQLLLLPEQFVALLENSGSSEPLACRVIRAGVEQRLSLRLRPEPPGPPGLRPAQSTLDLLPRKAPVVATVMQLADGTYQHRDGDFLVKLSGGNEPRLVVKDARGRIVFNGPIDTPERRSLVPPEVRERVEGLERLVARQRTEGPSSSAGGPPTSSEIRIGTLDIRPVEVK